MNGALPGPAQLCRPPLDHSIYNLQARKGRRGYTRRVNALSAIDPRDAAALLRRNAPELSSEVHLSYGDAHARRAARLQRLYSRALELAALAAFGRPFAFHDYQISTIACESFRDDWKDRLRRFRRAAQVHADMADAHFIAGGLRLRTALARRRQHLQDGSRS